MGMSTHPATTQGLPPRESEQVEAMGMPPLHTTPNFHKNPLSTVMAWPHHLHLTTGTSFHS